MIIYCLYVRGRFQECFSSDIALKAYIKQQHLKEGEYRIEVQNKEIKF